MGSCVFCSKEINNKGGLKVHENSCQLNPNGVKRTRSPNAGRQKGCTAWNKGLSHDDQIQMGIMTKDDSDRINVVLSANGQAATGKASTEHAELARKSKISEKMKSHGGYREGSGRGVKGWYKGIFCDSSWELAFVLYNIEMNGVVITKNSQKFPYTIDGVTRGYIPDFILEDGSYVEIKGYVTDTAREKIKQFPGKIVMYDHTHMKPIIDVVEAEFGKDFTRLYE